MPIINQTFLQKLRKEAKSLRKESTSTLTQIQDELARERGYPNWRTLIDYKGRGAVLVTHAEAWFRENYEAAASCSRIYPNISEPCEIFDIIASEFNFALEYKDGGRMVQLANNLADEDCWVSEKFRRGE